MSLSTWNVEKSAGEQRDGVAVARRRLICDRLLGAVSPALLGKVEYLLLQLR